MKKKLFIIGLILVLLAGVAYARMTVIGIAGVVGGDEITQGFIGSDGTIGGNNTAAQAVDEGIYAPYETTTAGYVNQVCFWLESTTTSDYYNVAIYNADGSQLLRDGSLTNGLGNDAYACVALDSSLEIQSDTTYILAAGSSTDTFWRTGRTNSTGSTWSYRVPMDVENTMPSTMSGGTSNANYKAHIYANYN